MNKRWAVILAFCGVFLAGAVVGGLVTRRSFAQKYPPSRHSGTGGFSAVIMRRYTARLGLDEVQREQLREVVRHAEGELRELRGSTFQETIAIGDRMNGQVEHLLRADQLERFEELKRDVQKYWERERERRAQSTRATEEKREHRPDSDRSRESQKK